MRQSTTERHATRPRRQPPAAVLTERVVEAEVIRVRFSKAFGANLWPNRRSLSRTFADHETTDAQH